MITGLGFGVGVVAVMVVVVVVVVVVGGGGGGGGGGMLVTGVTKYLSASNEMNFRYNHIYIFRKLYLHTHISSNF